MSALTEAPTVFGPVDAEPYSWPYDGQFSAANTALILIDWQVDFCGPGGYVDAMGYDLNLTRAPLEPTARVLAAARAAGLTIITPGRDTGPTSPIARRTSSGVAAHRRGYRRFRPGGRILVRGEAGWNIVPEVAPIEGEVIIDKPGKGAFYATDLDLLLRTHGITRII